MKNRLAVNYQRQSQSMNINKEQQWSWWTSCGCLHAALAVACVLKILIIRAELALYLHNICTVISPGSANVAQCYAALPVCSGHWQGGECFARLPSSSHCSI